ncbi:MAG: 50S ribosomal protein L30e [Candidatus Bathyarchaeia archaeon]
MDLQRELRLALESGEVSVGFREALKAVRTGKAKLLIVSMNHSDEVKGLLGDASEIPVYRFKGSNIDLGALCGKRHPISILAVKKPGTSDILSLVGGG